MMFRMGPCRINGAGQNVHLTVIEMSSLVVIMAIVVGVAVGSRRERMGEPFRKRPAARLFIVVLVIIVVLCVILANRPGV